MPPSRQSVSAIRSQHSGLVLSGDTHAQNELIKVLGPYFARAKFEDCGSEFLARFFNIWFTRWPLKVSDFEDEDFLLHHRQSVEKVLSDRLWWACFTKVEPEYTWRRYLAICEARYSVATRNPSYSSDHHDETSSMRTRSAVKPRPIPKKAQGRREESPNF